MRNVNNRLWSSSRICSRTTVFSDFYEWYQWSFAFKTNNQLCGWYGSHLRPETISNTQRYKNIRRLAEKKTKLSLDIDETTSIGFGKEDSSSALLNNKVSISSEAKYLGLTIYYKILIQKPQWQTHAKNGNILQHFLKDAENFNHKIVGDVHGINWTNRSTPNFDLWNTVLKTVLQKHIQDRRKISDSTSTKKNLIILRASWMQILF